MAVSTTRKDASQTVRLTTEASVPDFEVLRHSIFNIAMHAFLSDVLTLERMRSVIEAVNLGVSDDTNASIGLAAGVQMLARRGAYQGLCSAAGEGLTAAGLAVTQFSKLQGYHLPTDVGKTLVQETLALQRQIDQITRSADWLANSEVTSLQARGYEQLLQPFSTQANQGEESTISWTERFFQGDEFQPLQARSTTGAMLMLLGLLISGVLIGLRADYATA